MCIYFWSKGLRLHHDHAWWKYYFKLSFCNFKHRLILLITFDKYSFPVNSCYENIAFCFEKTSTNKHAAINIPPCTNRLAWWRHQMETFSAYLALCAGNSPVPVNSPHKGQWRGAFMFTLICVWINSWVNNREAGDLRRYRGHYDVCVMR